MASAALVGGIAAGGNILGGLFGNKGAQDAAKQMEQAGLNANALDYLLYGQQRQDLAPYTQAGANATNYLSYLLGIGGAPAGQTPASQVSSVGSGPRYKPTASAMAGMDNKNGTIAANGANSFTWTPGSGNKRGFTYMYSTDQGDVYQRSSGGKGTGINIDYAIVGQDGKVNFAANPPLPGISSPASSSQPQVTDAMKNDPNFGSLMHNFSANDFQTDPGYQFRLSEGQKAMERSAASKGGLFSGGTLKDLTNYNQNFASNEYQNAYNRFQQNRATQYNQLAALAGLGQVSAGQINADTGNLAQMNNSNTLNAASYAGNARASGYSALGKGLSSGLTDALNAGLNWYQMSQMGRPEASPQATPAAPSAYQIPTSSYNLAGAFAPTGY